ncbi:type IV pilus modification PilV family protein [Sutcliffiella deserti]|uniref:type IV pilus modification PilV family protein n=1 Tax=Sutcliffiella deserti TaxID=2875501 RepID=UPI001CBB88F3|nr:prepilin-type N-terminal cleavage/methylation domain-containing protein [Sutcliffiella deserti]
MNTVENCKVSDDRGFSLLEVLVSIVILSVIILSFLSFFSQAMFFSVREEDNLIGVNIAERILYNVEKSSIIELLSESTNTYSCENNPLSIGNAIADEEELKSDPNDPDRLIYIINNKSYYSYVTICQTEEEKKLSLYRTQIKIFQKFGERDGERMIYETYQYLNLR